MNAAPLAATPANTARRMPGARGRLSTLLVMAVTAVAILVAAAATNRGGTADGLTPVSLTGSPTGPAPIVGQAIPDFTATTTDGTAFRLADLKGKVVWLTFGATWCQPCRSENPDIKATYDAMKDRGVVVVQVYIQEEAATVRDYATRLGLGYTTIGDTSDVIATNYRILGVPSHFFIDRDGVLRQLRVGTMDPGSMQSILTELAG